MTFEIVASIDHTHSITGRVFAERTGKIYDFAFYKESGAVALSHGTRTVPENQMRDVRNFVSTKFAAPAVETVAESPEFSEAELRATTDVELAPVTHTLAPEFCGFCSGAAETMAREISPVEATELPADAPVLYFEQDGAYFSYRDRPFYYVSFDYVGPDGRTAGVCPSFHCEAPFHFPDFDMAGAERAAEWFAQEAARAGYRAERAPDYHATTAPVPCHPDEELTDLRTTRSERADGESGGFMTVAEFVAYRATPQEPAVRETFDTFETWRPAYLRLLHDWFSACDLEGRDLNEEDHYTAGLTPVAAANLECARICA